MKKILIGCALAVMGLSALAQRELFELTPLSPVPTQQQILWQQMETYAFIHFGLNTFTDKEWGYGDVDPKEFNPKNLDCEQWARTAKAAGMKGIILTAKHHDGFCLWPSKYTDYSVKYSPYKDGHGDIVRELSDACRKYGLKFGIYLSPWDRHHAQYGKEEYVKYYKNQLRELLSNYGEIFEVWLDGANGGDGWYGGAKETRKIDRKTYYHFDEIYAMVKQLQPNAVIFSDGGPGCRWVGNEDGLGSETNWSFIKDGLYPGYPEFEELGEGYADGTHWCAAECNTSIRPGWFYHKSEDKKVKSAETLVDLYYKNVGRNGTFLLNFPVDMNGRIPKKDSVNAVEFYDKIQKDFAVNLLAGVSCDASSERSDGYSKENLNDGDYNTFYASKIGAENVSMTFYLPKKEKINRIVLQEYIPMGQRVKEFALQYHDGKEWKEIDCGEKTTTIGYKRILRFKPVETQRLRVVVKSARGPVCISEVGAYLAK